MQRTFLIVFLAMLLGACTGDTAPDSSSSSSGNSGSGGLSPVERGAKLYFEPIGTSPSCAACHGDQGEGVFGIAGQLREKPAGLPGEVADDLCLTCGETGSLVSAIEVSMPRGDVNACVGQCAKDLTAYILQEFNDINVGDVSCDEPISLLSAMRRLNKSEISLSIDAVFGIGGAQFAAELQNEQEVIGGFATVGTALTTSQAWVAEYMDGAVAAAEKIVDEGAFAKKCDDDLANLGNGGSMVPPSGDQCNRTTECQTIYGSNATDCRDSSKDDSVCMCGNERCDANSNGGNGGPTIETVDQCFKDETRKVVEVLHRREYSDVELSALLTLKKNIARDTGAELDGTKAILVTAFMSGEFLFQLASDERDVRRDLTGPEMADRLAFALWGSVPDKTLLDLAKAGQLKGARLNQEIERLLDSARFDDFFDLFVDPWLGLGAYNIEGQNVGLSDAQWQLLLSDMKRESKLFFADIIKNNRPVDEIYTANYSFLNRRLALHYGFDASGLTDGDFVRRVFPQNSTRRGLMMHGSVLAKAFDGQKTSVVKRGVVPLEAFTCTAPKLPDDPSFQEQIQDLDNGAETEKEKLAVRADNLVCASCHGVIDAIGWVFTEFGADGKIIDKDPDGDSLSLAGTLSGQNFSNAYEMIDIMAADNNFASCLSSKILIHSLGRKINYGGSQEDRCAIDAAIAKATDTNGKVGARDLILTLLTSDISTVSGTIVAD